MQQLIQCGKNIAGCAGGWVVIHAITFLQSVILSVICEWMKKMAIGVMNAVWWIIHEAIRRHFGAVIMGIGLALQLDRMDDLWRLYAFLREGWAY